MIQPRIFIASSRESLLYAQTIQELLTEQGIIARGWWRSKEDDQGRRILDVIMERAERSNDGVFVFAPDDLLQSRGIKEYTVRDNVLLELGVFLGRLGIEHCFIVAILNDADQARLRIPANLNDVEPLIVKLPSEWQDPDKLIGRPRSDALENLRAVSEPASRSIVETIRLRLSESRGLPSEPCLIDELVRRERTGTRTRYTVGGAIDRSDLYFVMLSVVNTERSRIIIRDFLSDDTLAERYAEHEFRRLELIAMYDLSGKWDVLVKVRLDAKLTLFPLLVEELKQKLVSKGMLTYRKGEVADVGKEYDLTWVDVLQQSRSIAGLMSNEAEEETIQYRRLGNTVAYDQARSQRSFLYLKVPPNGQNRLTFLAELQNRIEGDERASAIIESACLAQESMLLELFMACSQTSYIHVLNRAIELVLTTRELPKYTLSAWVYDEQPHVLPGTD